MLLLRLLLELGALGAEGLDHLSWCLGQTRRAGEWVPACVDRRVYMLQSMAQQDTYNTTQGHESNRGSPPTLHTTNDVDIDNTQHTKRTLTAPL